MTDRSQSSLDRRVETIDGVSFAFTREPSSTPRVTGFNGRKRTPSRILFGAVGHDERRWAAVSMDEAREQCRAAAAYMRCWPESASSQPSSAEGAVSHKPSLEGITGDEELRMDAYYYGFNGTGVVLIDRILAAVACAGKAYHHTECWADETPPYEAVFRGNSPVEWIGNAAADAAELIKQLAAQSQGSEAAGPSSSSSSTGL